MAIQIYTANFCGYCTLAKKMLTKKKIPFVETNLTLEPTKRSEMIKRSNGRSSVPQIFISNMHVGGYDEISQLEKSGRLDAILRESKG
jgi:glutaredoxin 3